MAGRGYIGTGKSPFDDIQDALAGVHKRLDAFISATKQATMPTYRSLTIPNPGDLPDDPVQGQVAISADDDTLWFFSGGIWRKAGGDISWASLAGPDARNLYYPVIGGSTAWPQWSPDGFVTNDPEVFEYNDGGAAFNENGIKAKIPGLYMFMASDIIGSVVGDHSDLYAHLECNNSVGGQGTFSQSDTKGIPDSGNTVWFPNFGPCPVNMRTLYTPFSFTYFIQGLSTLATPPLHYPRMFIYRLASGIEVDFPFP